MHIMQGLGINAMIWLLVALLATAYPTQTPCPAHAVPVRLAIGNSVSQRCRCVEGTVCVGPRCRTNEENTISGFEVPCLSCHCTMQTNTVPPGRPDGPRDLHNPSDNRLDSTKLYQDAEYRKSGVQDPTGQEPEVRRQCVTSHLQQAMAHPDNPNFYLKGCDLEPLWGFTEWATATGCGTEPIDGRLRFHTAWGGPLTKIMAELRALLNSFLVTQDPDHSEFVFWWLMAPDQEGREFQSHFESFGQGTIVFRTVDWDELAEGTCLADHPEMLHIDPAAVGMKIQTKINMLRLQILYQYGGVWVDTDTVLLRDFRPLAEFAGEFASRMTMSHIYNNNVLLLRQRSPLARTLLEMVCRTPWGGRSNAVQYCSLVGEPCVQTWWWNHGPIQYAVRQKLGLVPLPFTFFDPAYSCYMQGIMGKSGGNWQLRYRTFDDLLEMLRGVFSMHTRSNQADKPISPASAFGLFYRLLEEQATAGIRHQNVVPVGRRSPAQQTRVLSLVALHHDPTAVDPPFLPRSSRQHIMLHNLHLQRLATFYKVPYKPIMQFVMNHKTADARVNQIREATWWWYPGEGFIRPTCVRISNVVCLDGLPARPEADWDPAPVFNTCNPDRPSQRWSYDAKLQQLRNRHLNLCLFATSRTSQSDVVALRDCGVEWRQLQWELLPVDFDSDPDCP